MIGSGEGTLATVFGLPGEGQKAIVPQAAHAPEVLIEDVEAPMLIDVEVPPMDEALPIATQSSSPLMAAHPPEQPTEEMPQLPPEQPTEEVPPTLSREMPPRSPI